MSRGIVLSLCDRTGVMVEPWLEAGYECWTVDLQHPVTRGIDRDGWGHLRQVKGDVRAFRLPDDCTPVIVFAFPPCTHLAVSGARWFADKGLEALHEAIGLVVAAKRLCEASGAPWMLENPVGTLSSYWRTPDYTFQPWQYGDRYTKKTCLWTGNGFVMPAPWIAHKPADVKASIHLMPPSADRADKRSITPAGFARAVFEANEPRISGASGMTTPSDEREDCYQCDGDGFAGIHNCPRCGGGGKEPATKRRRYCEMCDKWFGARAYECPECGAGTIRAEISA